MASLRPDTGVSRGPQRYGAAVKDSDRDALRDQLRRFEALVEPGNEEHQQVSAARDPGCWTSRCAGVKHGCKGGQERSKRHTTRRQHPDGLVTRVCTHRLQILRQMKEHTQELEFQRGVWCVLQGRGVHGSRCRQVTPLSPHRTQRGMPGVTRDWNPAPKHGSPPPEQAVLELKAWRDATRKTALLLAGQPLPPELKGEPPRRIMDVPASDTRPSEAPRAARCGIRTAGCTRASFLAQLDSESAIDWDV